VRSQPPALSVVVPCLGHAAELAACLEALENQKGDVAFEVIVVDSAFDARVEAVVQRHPEARLYRSRALLSTGAARNAGVRLASAPALGFIDADCLPHTGWVQGAMAALAAGAVLASGPILDASPWQWVASSDNRLQFADFAPGRPAGPLEYCAGAHFVVTREAFDSQAGFREDHVLVEDVLFTAGIAALRPKQVRFSREMVVQHRGRARWKDFLEHQRSFGYARSRHSIRMGPSFVWLSSRPALSWLVVLRRLSYVGARVLQWNTLDLPRFVLQLPLLVAGLVAWTQGFYAGAKRHGQDRAVTPVARDSN